MYSQTLPAMCVTISAELGEEEKIYKAIDGLLERYAQNYNINFDINIESEAMHREVQKDGLQAQEHAEGAL